jgi:hypothetical protein
MSRGGRLALLRTIQTRLDTYKRRRRWRRIHGIGRR